MVGFTSVGKPLSVGMRGEERISLASARTSARDRELLGEWIEAGKLRPVIDRSYPFVEPPQRSAISRGRRAGKVVVGDFS